MPFKFVWRNVKCQVRLPLSARLPMRIPRLQRTPTVVGLLPVSGGCNTWRPGSRGVGSARPPAHGATAPTSACWGGSNSRLSCWPTLGCALPSCVPRSPSRKLWPVRPPGSSTLEWSCPTSGSWQGQPGYLTALAAHAQFLRPVLQCDHHGQRLDDALGA